MLKESKTTCNAPQAKAILKDFPPQLTDLIQRMLVFNPSKRITIQEILESEVVRQFKKGEEETICTKEIRTSIDDNKKLTVDEYRTLVYAAGTKTLTKTESLNCLEKVALYKKSGSYTKLNTLPGAPEVEQVNDREAIKQYRSCKDIKPLHASNKSIDVPAAEPETTVSREPPKEPNAPKSWIYKKPNDGRYKVPINQSTGGMLAAQTEVPGPTYSKFIGPKAPLFKSSKLIMQKTEQTDKNVAL
jgi:serine/threonine protein kinase